MENSDLKIKNIQQDIYKFFNELTNDYYRKFAKHLQTDSYNNEILEKAEEYDSKAISLASDLVELYNKIIKEMEDK